MWEVKFSTASPKEELQVYRYRFKSHKPGHKKARYTFPGPEMPKTHANTQFNTTSRLAFSVSILSNPTLPMAMVRCP